MKTGVKENPGAGLCEMWYLGVRNAHSQVPFQSLLPPGVSM